MKKVILIVLDGLNASTAQTKLGFMQHLTEQGIATYHTIRSELPAMSRPLYETLLTGTAPIQHGVTNNHIQRRSHEKSLFDLATENGMTTAAVAYHWVCELYNHCPFDPRTDRYVHDTEKAIQHGVFYWEDNYPDSHLFYDAQKLIDAYDPDFILIHPMNIDLAGHQHGGDSKAYKTAAMTADVLLSQFLPEWIEKSYHIIVTADHGMDADGLHNGDTESERLVPLFTIGDQFAKHANTQALDQKTLAPAICTILGIKPPEAMAEPYHSLVKESVAIKEDLHYE